MNKKNIWTRRRTTSSFDKVREFILGGPLGQKPCHLLVSIGLLAQLSCHLSAFYWLVGKTHGRRWHAGKWPDTNKDEKTTSSQIAVGQISGEAA